MTSTRYRLAWPAWALALLLAGLTLIATLGGSSATAPPEAGAQAGEGRYSVLVFSRTTGFRHTEAIDAGRTALSDMADAEDFDVTLSEDPGEFTNHDLRGYDVVVFLNTDGEGVLNQTQRIAFERWTQRGGAAVRIHADANADKAWDWKRDIMGGGLFEGHPPIQEATVEVADATHPSTDDLPASFQWTDEWYNFEADPREDVHVLITVDESTYDGGEHGDGHPIAWCSEYDGGRNFYTAIGHHGDDATPAWSDDRYLDHIAGALEWAAGEEPGNCGEPRLGLPTESTLRRVPLDDETENPMELDVAPDGRVFFVEIGAGAVDSFDSAVKMYDPEADETHVVGEVPVHRRNENGLLGIALDPSFDQNNFIYLFYSVPGPQLEMGTQHISRFTFDPSQGEVGQIDMDSEVVLLEVPHQRLVCCHSAGSLAFGPEGHLYATLGDDTTPFETDGYAPIDGRDCGPGDADGCDPETWPEDSIHAYDARRTSGNAADLRGKLLRIDPIESATPSEEPGVGSTYEVPGDNLFTSGEYDHLFPGGEYDPELGRPEIYAMGFRNPFRLTVDEETGDVYVGQVGPDADEDCFPGDGGSCDENPRGPRGYDVMMQISEAANMGWPYCLAGQGYYSHDYATGTSGDQYDCEGGPTNDSPHNTGIDTLPPVTDPLLWYPYGSSPEFPEIPAGNARAAMAGPVYRYDPALESEVKLGEWFDDRLIWGDWSRNVMLATELDENDDYVTTDRLLGDTLIRHPHDIEVGPDGALYVIEWGLEFNFAGQGINPDSGLYRIEHRPGEHPPVASPQASASFGPTPLEVQFNGELSDRGGSEPPSYEWDFGDGETSTEVNPSHTFTEPGQYDVALTVSDGEVTSEDSVTINVVGSTCVTRTSDDFDGLLPHPAWEILREDAGAWGMGDGTLEIELQGSGFGDPPLDMEGEAATTSNVFLQDAPEGPWRATTSIDTTEIFDGFGGVGGEAGIIVWESEDPNTFSKLVLARGGFGDDGAAVEHVHTAEDEADFDEARDATEVGEVDAIMIRVTRTAAGEVSGEYSLDDGESWESIGADSLHGFEGPLRVGVMARRDFSFGDGPVAAFDSLTVEATDCGGPVPESTEPPHLYTNAGGINPEDVAPGHMIRCRPGEWTRSGPYSIQWLRQEGGGPWEQVDRGTDPGETGSNRPRRFRAAPAHGGFEVACAVTRTNINGGSTPAYSPATLVQVAVPENLVPPEIVDSGNNPVSEIGPNRKLKCPPGQWTRSGPYTVEWFVDGEPGDNGTPRPRVFFTTPAHEGAEIHCEVTRENRNGVSEPASSQVVTVPGEGAEDTMPPVTIVQLNGDAPQPTYEGEVEVTLTASDPGDDASGVAFSEYRIDSDDPGDWEEYDPLEPPVVSGEGEHDVDYRSTDNAANVEETQTVAFTIDLGPETHEVDSVGAEWDPDQLAIDLGDEIQWNFDAELTTFPHDVYLVPPGGDRNPEGEDIFEVTDDPQPAGSPPVSYTPDEQGEWMYICQVHSVYVDGEWTGSMFGFADVG